MTLAIFHSRAQAGLDAPPVNVEVHLAPGLPSFSIVGLAATAVKESRDRVRAVLVNAGFKFPQRRIIVNLAPADLPKDGGRFDLPIALGILAADEHLPGQRFEGHEILGELSLDGTLRPVSGALPAALGASRSGRTLVLPRGNAEEAVLASGVSVLPAATLMEIFSHFGYGRKLEPQPPGTGKAVQPAYPDLAEVRGQAHARRALEIAACGAHSLLYVGPPGSGKSMLAGRLPGILPPMSEDEALESAAIASVSTQGFRL